jgi:hypothetical protein
VLIITALSLEMAAVRKHTAHIGSCQGRDGNVFEIGHFGGSGSDWVVVVGESGAGNHLSQAIVTNACMEFRPFELILFVGVAASRKPDDAPIGSVVVSDHIYFPYGGKFQGGQLLLAPGSFRLTANFWDWPIHSITLEYAAESGAAEIHPEVFSACGHRRAVAPPAAGFDERLAVGSNFP